MSVPRRLPRPEPRPPPAPKLPRSLVRGGLVLPEPRPREAVGGPLPAIGGTVLCLVTRHCDPQFPANGSDSMAALADS